MTSTANPDYWSLLGIRPDSDAAQLKRAFRREARRWHPDLNGNDPVAEERFKLVNEAYAVLNDPRRRDAWQRGGGAVAADDDPFSTGFPDFEDYLDVIFGRRERHDDPEPEPEVMPWQATDGHESSERPVAAPAPPPPVLAVEDLESVVELTPDQALLGTQVELTLGDGTLIQLDTPPLPVMVGVCGLRVLLQVDEIISCSCASSPTRDCVLMVCGCTTNWSSFPLMRPSAVPWMCQPLMVLSPCRFLLALPAVVFYVCGAGDSPSTINWAINSLKWWW